ncbi:hypothetical protein RRF57_011088 [Xylaria bambusicola]|uniref:Uncharacterized protein n=1 Tax=Xylaria bambusicola TaxID=326684 RepID=A0AAN7ZCW8_9PEZI
MDRLIREHCPYSIAASGGLSGEANSITMFWQREALEEKLPGACIEANQPQPIIKAVTEHFLCMTAIQSGATAVEIT